MTLVADGTRTLHPHERAQLTADADLLRDAGDALNLAFNGLSTTDKRLEQLAEEFWERANDLDEAVHDGLVKA